MELQALLDKLYSLHRFGIKPGLERTLKLLQAIGNPHHDLRCIHVAGTNGKGSVSSLCASILMEQGLRVGLYTSPHLIRFNERMQVQGECVSDSDLVLLYRKLESTAELIGATFFEVTTAMAFLYFKQAKTDICVIECGMGGRYDSTNVISPLVSVITSVDLDHMEYLGTTLEAICLEKCGIIKHMIPVICAEPRTALRSLIKEQSQRNEAEYIYAPEYVVVQDRGIDAELHAVVDIQALQMHCEGLRTPLSGEHQRRNVAAALSALFQLPTGLQPSVDAIERGMRNVFQNTQLQGRIQLRSLKPPVIIDVGHNPACMRELSHTLSDSPYANTKFNVVFGAMADKDIEKMLDTIHPHCARLFSTQAHTERALDSSKLTRIAAEKGFEVVECSDVTHAVQLACEREEAVLICGSFYLMEQTLPEVDRILEERKLQR